MNLRVALIVGAAILGSSLVVATDLTDRAVDFLSLSRAARDGDMISVKALIRRGVDPNGVEFDGSNAASYLAHDYDRPLQAAAEHGHADIAAFLLERGAKPDWCCCSCVTALHLAILGGHEKVVAALLEGDADASLPFEDGRSCLEVATDLGHDSIAALLVGNADDR